MHVQPSTNWDSLKVKFVCWKMKFPSVHRPAVLCTRQPTVQTVLHGRSLCSCLRRRAEWWWWQRWSPRSDLRSIERFLKVILVNSVQHTFCHLASSDKLACHRNAHLLRFQFASFHPLKLVHHVWLVCCCFFLSRCCSQRWRPSSRSIAARVLVCIGDVRTQTDKRHRKISLKLAKFQTRLCKCA